MSDLALVVIPLAFALAGLTQVPALWTGKKPWLHKTPGWWLWGDPLWRGFMRAWPTLIVTGVAFAVLGSALILTTAVPGQPSPVMAAALLIALFGGLGLVLAIILVNWPRALVPPHLREQSGALEDWLGRGR